jgi:hypothetical protein
MARPDSDNTTAMPLLHLWFFAAPLLRFQLPPVYYASNSANSHTCSVSFASIAGGYANRAMDPAHLLSDCQIVPFDNRGRDSCGIGVTENWDQLHRSNLGRAITQRYGATDRKGNRLQFSINALF